MAKGGVAPLSRTLGHWSLDDIQAGLKDFSAPTGDFDADGEWSHTYAIAVRGTAAGALRLRRATVEEGFALHVDQEAMLSGATQRTTATLHCAADAVASIRAWTLDTVTVDKEGEPLEETRVTLSGNVGSERVIQAGLPDMPRDSSLPLTSNWSLLEAVQRLARHGTAKSLQFEMLDEMGALRHNQRLVRYETIEADLPNGKISVTGFCQSGEGVLPTHYWLDAQGRLLFVIAGYRALIWQAKG
jgi:hypothetical protein